MRVWRILKIDNELVQKHKTMPCGTGEYLSEPTTYAEAISKNWFIYNLHKSCLSILDMIFDLRVHTITNSGFWIEDYEFKMVIRNHNLKILSDGKLVGLDMFIGGPIGSGIFQWLEYIMPDIFFFSQDILDNESFDNYICTRYYLAKKNEVYIKTWKL